MGCQSSCQRQQSSREHCIKDIVRQIVRAQKKAAERDTVTCITSCERSINDLLSPDRDRRPRHTTIPFMLVCKNSCKYFVGSGIVKNFVAGEPIFECIESPVFKARGFVKGSNHCVKLELLTPLSNGNGGENNQTTCTPCDFFATMNDNNVYGFQETGVCITVDLDAFIGITCLDPITPVKAP